MHRIGHGSHIVHIASTVITIYHSKHVVFFSCLHMATVVENPCRLSQISPHQQSFLCSTFECCWSLCWFHEDQRASWPWHLFCFNFIVRSGAFNAITGLMTQHILRKMLLISESKLLFVFFAKVSVEFIRKLFVLFLTVKVISSTQDLLIVLVV